MIFELLKQGQENSIPTSILVNVTGCRSARELQSHIAEERAAGHLILSTCRGRGGYYLPAPGPQGKAEIEAFCRTLQARALNTLVALHDARRALAEIDRQLSIPASEVQNGRQ